MKNFLKNHGLWVLFAAAVISVALAVMSFFSNTSAPLSNLAGVLASPFRSAYTSVATWFNDKQNYYKDNTALEEENAALRKQLAEMEKAIRQAEEDSAENERLRELLNMAEEHDDYQFLSAYIIAWDSTNWKSTFTVNKGRLDGLEEGMCAVTEFGQVVGLVTAVGEMAVEYFRYGP